ncbi:MAG: hypothetical protein EOM69_00965 [Clostridia bacterium]|nr:hypothetical protein [Clostridia bacterium]
MKKLKVQKLLRIVAALIIIVGACVGYDMGDKMVSIDQTITYQFDFWLAIFVWFIGLSLGLLFWSIAKIIDLLESK